MIIDRLRGIFIFVLLPLLITPNTLGAFQENRGSRLVDKMTAFREQILRLNREIEEGASTSRSTTPEQRQLQMETRLKQRAAALQELIKNDPASALSLGLEPETRNGLAILGSSVEDLLESEGLWQGRLEAVAEDDFRSGTSRTVHYLTGTHGSLEVYFAGEKPPYATGQYVTVSGLRLGRLAAARQWQYVGTGGIGAAAEAAGCSAIGEQRIAVLLVSMPSKPLLSAVTPDMMQKAYFGPGLSVDSFLRESSYGKAWATGQVVGPVVLDADYIGQPTAARDAAIRAASRLVDFRNFSRIALVVPQSSTGLVSGGLGTMGCSEVPLYPNGSVVASTTWLGDVSLGSEDYRVATGSHEMGHNLGLGHAMVADFGNEPLGPVGQLPAPFDSWREYGDSFSNMGTGLGQWSAYHKSFLGWLQSETDVLNVDTGGTNTLRPYEDPNGGVKAIRVRRGTGNDTWLWLENRQPLGMYDSSLPASAFTGAIIHYEDSNWGLMAALLRFNFDNILFFRDAPLAAGTSWTDPYSNLTISLNRGAVGSLEVRVSYAAASVCPGILNPNKISFEAAGGTASIDVVAPSGCTWTATPSVTWIQISSGASGAGNGRLSFSVSPSAVSADRWGRIVVGSTTAVVSQKGLAGNASISPLSASFPETGGAGEISVSTNTPDFQWSFESNASWIQSLFCSKWLSVGPATVRYVVAQNTSSAPRAGTITIAGHVFTVTQAAGNLKVSKLVWQDLLVQDAPTSRLRMASASLATWGEVVLYGGLCNTAVFSDTWVWDGAGWLQKHPLHSPGPRAYSAMAYDVTRGQIVLFGGTAQWYPGESANDTWIWDGTDWREIYPKNSPPARSGHAMACHATSGKIVLFGGVGVDGYLNDTWEWDGSNWTQRISPAVPLSRSDHAMTYDAARSEIVLFGGFRNSGFPVWLADTWVWDGLEWRQRITDVSPSPRVGPGMEYHPGLGQVILVGGYGGKDVQASTWVYDYREETWTWNGTNWTQTYPDMSPEFSWTYCMAYDPVHEEFIAHLGDDLHCATRGPKTYVLKTGPGAILLAPYNANIPGSGGQGSIAVTASVPWVATSLDSWIKITGGGSGNGNGTVHYEISANSAGGKRTGTINVGGQLFSIRQESLAKASIDLVLNAGGAANAVTFGDQNLTQVGYASVGLRSTGTPYSTAVFSYRQNGVVVSEAAVPASPPTTSSRILIDYRSKPGGIFINTGLAVVNCGTSPANVTYTLRGLNGATLAAGHGVLAAGSHYARFIDQLKDIASDFNLPADFPVAVQFASLDIVSSQPLSVIALRMTTNQRNEALFTTTPIANLTQRPGNEPVYFPQFVDGGGYTTALVLMNTSSATESGTFQIWDNDGVPLVVGQAGGVAGSSFRYSIPSGGAMYFESNGVPQDVRAGWVQLTPDNGNTSPVSMGVFGYTQDGVLVTESGVPGVVLTTHARIYVDLTAGHNTGLAIANPARSNAVITINAFQSDGINSIGISKPPFTLAGGGHAAKFADEFIEGLPPGFTGVLDISSTTPFAAVTLRSLYNERGEFLITTFPIADANRAAPSPIIFPQIADGGGYLTQFIFISSGEASAMVLNFLNQDGTPLAIGK